MSFEEFGANDGVEAVHVASGLAPFFEVQRALELLENIERVLDFEGTRFDVVRANGFDPASHRLLCRMHFVFPDGSRIRNAFVYDWRLWTLPELREALEDAGFRNLHILWETMDSRTGMGNGRMRRVERGRMEGAWYAMILCQA